MRSVIGFVSVLAVGSACSYDHPVKDVSDAHLSSTASSDAPVDAADPASRIGMVGLLNTKRETGKVSGTAFAVFAPGAPWGAQVGSDGPCIANVNRPREGASAGGIAITGTSVPFPTWMPQPNEGKQLYEFPELPLHERLFAAGTQLHVAAAGATVPAFTANVTGPVAIAGVHVPQTLSRAAGAKLTWRPGTGTIWLIVNASDSVSDAIVWCSLPDTGSYTLTASNLALLTNPGPSAEILLGRVATDEPATPAGKVLVFALDTVDLHVPLTP